MDDTILRQTLITELDFEPSINSALIGVAVEDGVVTLTGHVSSYAENSLQRRPSSASRELKRSRKKLRFATLMQRSRRTTKSQKRAIDVLKWDVRCSRRPHPSKGAEWLDHSLR